MKLTIEIPCSSGVEMEDRLNKAISGFSEALKKRGFVEMELIGYLADVGTDFAPIYKLTLNQNEPS